MARQRGAVLILALLIVALVATLAVNYASQMLLVQARAENRVYGAQQDIYADSMIDMAVRLLKEDSPDLDHLQEDWAFPGGASYSVEGGFIQGELIDAQAVFNLNDLSGPIADKPNPLDMTRFTEPQRRFIRFLQTFDGNAAGGGAKDAAPDPTAEPALAIDINQAVMITEAIVDWIDADDDPAGFGGAESLQYQQTGVTWVPPNGLMASVEELKLVQHITPEIYQAVRPFVTVLPTATAGLNINTVVEVKILQSLNSASADRPLNAEDLGGFGSWRGEAGFPNSDTLANNADFKTLLGEGNFETAGLSVNSNHFWLNVEVQLADKVINRRMLLQRGDTGIKVLARYASGQSTAMPVLMAPDDAEDNGDSGDRPAEREEESDNKR